MVSLLNFGGARSTSQISGSLAGWDFGGICGILQPLGFDGFGGGTILWMMESVGAGGPNPGEIMENDREEWMK